MAAVVDVASSAGQGVPLKGERGVGRLFYRRYLFCSSCPLVKQKVESAHQRQGFEAREVVRGSARGKPQEVVFEPLRLEGFPVFPFRFACFTKAEKAGRPFEFVVVLDPVDKQGRETSEKATSATL